MKKYSLIFLNFIVGFLLFSSCVDEELVGQEDGKTTTVSLSFEAPDVKQIVTKGVNDYTLIQGLYLFVFDSKGDIEGEGPLYYSINSSNNTGTIDPKIPTTTGNHYIFAIANPTGSAFASIGDLSAISTKKELLSMTAKLKGDLLMSGNIIPMAGVIKEGNADGLINITAGSSYTVQLERIIASVKFKVSCGNEGATFDLKSYEVVNVPQQTSLWGDNVASETKPWSGGIINSSTSEQIFEFYMFENKQQAIGSITDYNDRETKKNPADVKDIEFANASPHASYVILKGLYVGLASVGGNWENVSAEVSYYVHLGDINKGFDNFETCRNVEYTYTISIKGVKELVAEVETDDPYDRGDGTISLVASSFDLDAHYEFFNITVPKGTDYSIEGSTDLDWVSFRIYDEQPDNLMDALVPGEVADWDKVMKYKKSNDDQYNGELIITMKLLNEKLASYFLKNPTAREVKLTCFVDENEGNDFRECLVFRDRKSQNGSTLLRNGFKFRQNYMRKFFDNKGGYAVEVLNETGELKTYGVAGVLSGTSNGWENMFAQNTTFPGKGEMQKVYAACMSRNRDDNGNGIIDDNEKKWYLPARDQYVGLWIGADPLKEARLYTKDASVRRHYMSNSAKAKDSQWILWAEQGCATGGHKDDDGGTSYDLRCIRNFGSTNTVKYYDDDKTHKVITMHLVDGAYRNKQESGELGQGGHIDTDNKVYRKFEVAKDIIGDKELSLDNQRDLANVNNSACSYYGLVFYEDCGEYEYGLGLSGYFKYVGKNGGNWSEILGRMIRVREGGGQYMKITVEKAYSNYSDHGKWRLPNQRELAVMYSAGYLDDLDKYGYIFSRTYSSFVLNSGFMFNSSNNNLIQEPSGTLDGSVRCVKDID